MVVGSHVDSVPNGGWLDGALGVMARSRCCATRGRRARRPCTVALVDWADEEGARFGRSLFGSSAAAGTLDPDAVRDLRDAGGRRLEDVRARARRRARPRARGGLAARATRAPTSSCTSSRGRCSSARASPSARCSARSASSGTALIFRGQAAHAGSTPMDQPPRLVPGRGALRARAARGRAAATAASARSATRAASPGVVTAVPGATTLLARPAPPRRRRRWPRCWPSRASAPRRAPPAPRAARSSSSTLWRIEPIPFDAGADRGGARRLPGGRRAPTVALPCGPAPRRGRDGAARADGDDLLLLDERPQPPREEDTPVEHLELAIRAYALTASAAIERVAAG